ncbi:lipoprotein, putative [Citrifermentans bemidjiense Bem]|uniref:Lipoprotein, putative n=1 Tax=Citrifermentans bemidjiense (strain ATCC BAA-1014 / DSM 16622 / JCM 12645 / Bem) TaxID=404380 RepID=B5EEU7_CITBB|nr:YMGG-like glycine zipper-containing protein [Citrifermentans bemidjiense]ACH37843.1 lipoprotein, putative [Citrifermentans bemidjiense Bem]
MKKHSRTAAWLLLALLGVSGCATVPTGPSVRVLPAPGKSFEQFMAEDAVCRRWSEQQLGLNRQDTVNQNTATSAVVGTAVGAGVGALLGAAGGNAGTGAAIGGGTGLLFGAASGSESGRAYGYEAQRLYDNTYVQCMYSKGNQIPGSVRKVRRVRTVAPPPPPDMYSVPPDYYPAR